MQRGFDHAAIEKKWQERWQRDGLYTAGDRDTTKEKEYVLVELPYPSGNLHIGHWYAFAIPDIYVRFRRMTGKQVVYPIGFDAFGLPAENAAIKRDINPREWTESNIAHMKKQLASMGNAFSWDKTASTADPDYYKWTQRMFTLFFENDIAYRGTGVVNWCPSCNTVLANEQVQSDNTCDRCGTSIEKREMDEWKLRITNYADRLLTDLDSLDWPEHIKDAQRNWIGRSSGARIPFTLSSGDAVDVFTTRPDTLFGATYLVFAPENALVTELQSSIKNWNEVASYIESAKQKDEQDRLDATKEKTGVRLEGVTAVNPASGEEIPVYIADYVLAHYGTGAIMAVPAHDERDAEFAAKFDLPVKQVVRKIFGEPLPDPVHRVAAGAIVHDPKTDKYLIQYSHEFEKHTPIFGGIEEGETYAEAAVRETLEETGYRTKFLRYVGGEVESHFYHPGKKINRALVSRMVLLELQDDTPEQVSADELEKQEPKWVTADDLKRLLTDERDAYDVSMLFGERVFGGVGTLCNSGDFDGIDSDEAKKAITEKVGGKMTNTYKLRDWSIGRQRYWGVPIPIVYDPEGNAHPVPEEHLPWTLPDDVDFRPTGEPPLAKSNELKERTERIFGTGWTPEVETMDTFVDSSWYFLRYLDATNDSAPISKQVQEDWMPIDIYFGGAEHTTMHLLYSRFWQKALYDLRLVIHQEPYTKRINRGLVLGPDGNKMSKSKGNVIDPDTHVAEKGADTVKMYLAFMGPYGEVANYPWDMGGIAGIRRFLERVASLADGFLEAEQESVTRQLHKTIMKVRADIPAYKFNTAISSMMMFVNVAEEHGVTKAQYERFLCLLAPFAPHLSEELWEQCGNSYSVHQQPYPEADASLAVDDTVTIGVQVNGKVRGSITLPIDTDEATAVTAGKAEPSVVRHLDDAKIVKTVYVPNRILNFITK